MDPPNSEDLILQGLSSIIPLDLSGPPINADDLVWKPDDIAILNGLTCEGMNIEQHDGSQKENQNKEWENPLNLRNAAKLHDWQANSITIKYLPLLELDQNQAWNNYQNEHIEPKGISHPPSSATDYPWIVLSQQSAEVPPSKSDLQLYLQGSDRIILKIRKITYNSDEFLQVPVQICSEMGKLKLRLDSTTIVAALVEFTSQFQCEFIENIPEFFEDHFVYILCERIFGETQWEVDFSGHYLGLLRICQFFVKESEVVFVGSSWTRFTLMERYKTRLIGSTGTVFAVESVPILFEEFCNHKTHNSHLQTTRASYPLKSIEDLADICPLTEEVETEAIENAVEKERTYTSTLMYSRSEVSAVIGIHGNRLNAIREDTKCKIEVIPISNLTLSTSRRSTPQQLLLTGKRTSIIDAAKQIQDLVIKFKNGDFRFI